MIHFCCEHCGTHLAIYQGQAGKTTTCPACSEKIAVPFPRSNTLAPEPPPTDPYDPDLFSIPDVADIPGTRAHAQAVIKEALSVTPQETPLPRRPYPWPLDIFLYPLNKGGLLTLGTIVGTLLVCGLLAGLAWLIISLIPFLAILLPLGIMIALLVFVIMSLYYVWYVCDCLRNSAEGYIRAPDTLGMAPGLRELFGQFLYILICVLIFFSLGTALHAWLKSTGWITGLLQAGILYLFLMTLLCVIITDSLAGLNPLLSLRAIYHTWPSFSVLVGFVGCLLAVPVVLWHLITRVGLLPRNGWSLMGITACLSPYLLLVTAHVLGRFYFKYEDKLKWDV